jgi:excisionase family DNA binding protein
MNVDTTYHHYLTLTGDIQAAATLTLAVATAKVETPSGDYLTVRQAAARYKLGLRTVYRLVERGLPVTRVGKAIRIQASDLEQRLADQDSIFD